jgi:hypothetical protein
MTKKTPTPAEQAAMRMLDTFGPSLSIYALRQALKTYAKRMRDEDATKMVCEELDTASERYDSAAEWIDAAIRAIPDDPETTISRAELARLAACNSSQLPLVIADGGVRRRWVGIGWVTEGPADGSEQAMIVDASPL